MDRNRINTLALRILNLRAAIIKEYPFFGRLLLRLPFGFEECGTAYTDMRKIVFDPAFADELSDAELRFVMLHECMHCVLNHCIRGKGKIGIIYNIACDIVVNSIILDAMGIKDINISNKKAMHLLPDGSEGRIYNAEEVYQKLLKHTVEEIEKWSLDGMVDSHDIWVQVSSDSVLEAIWSEYIKDASKGQGTGTGIPDSIKRLIEDIYEKPKINWKQLLHDFIQQDVFDYTYLKPDKKWQGDIIMPAFQEDSEALRNFWFLVDTSASVSTHSLSLIMSEIESATNQIENISAYISFFDCDVSTPINFENQKEFKKITPVGGGGTSFKNIFKKMEDYFTDLPSGIIILTDGYASFPDAEIAKDIPVFWIIIDSLVEPPWGTTVHIQSEKIGK